jgi:predicted deacylase
MATIEIDGIVAGPGEKAFGFIEAGTTSVNTYRIPVAILNGVEEGTTLCLLGGTHGTEFVSIEAVIRTIQNVDPKKMKGAILAVPVLNGPQFEHRSAFLSPFDQLNQNRVFPGDPEGTLSRRTAHAVFSKIVSKADALCDCHGGDITEDLDIFVIAGQGEDEEINRKAIEMARCFPCKIITARKGGMVGSSHTAMEMYGIPCITSEAGTPANVRERHVKFNYDGIQNLLRYFGILEGEHVLYDAVINPEEYAVKAKRGGIWRSKVELGQEVEAGQELGYMTDLFGNVLETYKTPEKGVIKFLRVWYSVNTGEPLITVSHV